MYWSYALYYHCGDLIVHPCIWYRDIWYRDICARIWTRWTLHTRGMLVHFRVLRLFPMSGGLSLLYISLFTGIIQNKSGNNIQRVVVWHTCAVCKAARNIVKILPVAVHSLYNSLIWRTGRGSSSSTLVSKISTTKIFRALKTTW